MKLKELFLTYKNQDEFVKAVNAELKKLIEENPSFCYVDKDVIAKVNNKIHHAIASGNVSCKYNGPAVNSETGEVIGNPSSGCIFGQALQKLGWNDEFEMNRQHSINSLLGDYIGRDIFCYVPQWCSIQIDQDSGNNWGSLLSNLE